MGRGRFVVLEGGEASGKSTQAARLATTVGGMLTREPGGTEVGERLRALLLNPSLPTVTARAEALMMLAARAQHVTEVIEPALARGDDVVCDRYSGSTIAYQGHGRGLAVAELEWLSGWAAAGLVPDRVVLLAVPTEVAAARLHRRSLPSAGSAGSAGLRDRMEREGDDFFARVAAGFAALAAADPYRWRVVDGTGRPDEVAQRVLDAWT